MSNISKHIRFLFCIAAMLCAGYSYGQEQEAVAKKNGADSLKEVLPFAASDSEKVKILNKIVDYYKNHGKFSTGLPYALTSYKLAQNAGQPKRLAYACHSLGLLYLNMGRADSALMYDKQALDYYLAKGPKEMLYKVYTSLGAIYKALTKYNEGVDSYTKALAVATELKDTAGTHSTYFSIGRIYDQEGQYKMAIDYYDKALEVAKGANMYLSVMYDCLAKGNLYGIQGIYPSALEAYFEGLKVNSSHIKRDDVTAVYDVNIGNIYQHQNDTGKVMKYYNDALKLFIKTKDSNHEAILLGNIGNMYMESGDYKKAESYQDRSMQKLILYNDRQELSLNYTNRGELYRKTKEYMKSLDYYNKALIMQEESNDLEGQAYTLSGISSLFVEMGEYKQAEDYGIRCFDIAKKSDMVRILNEECKTLSDMFEKTKQADKALFYYKEYIAAKDTMDNKAASERIIRSELNYEYDQKQQEEKLQDEKKEALNAEKARHERVVRNVYLGGFVIVLLLTILLLRNFLKVRSANKIITEQKAVVEQQKTIVDQKNRDITDSINYAQRIQQAMLPTVEQWDHFFKESFIYYKPKDIVSGDFYWCMGVGNDIVLAVADCTGHGVPGAFMSMLGISSLNKIVGEQGVKQPDKILNGLRDEIIKSLNPEGKKEEVKDGMDMTLCYMNLKTGTLEYAAANNPLWIIRKDGQEYKLIELDADKMPVGKYLEDGKLFSSKKVEIKKGDRVYLFTDGYADQFGGEKGKKFKYKHLQEVLLSWQNKNMTEQKALLEKLMDDWKGDLEQVDDMLVAGVEIV